MSQAQHSVDGINWVDCNHMVGDCGFRQHRIKWSESVAQPSLGERAAQWLEEVAALVREKNKAYGDSLGSPLRVFSKADPLELILARMDDKLSRISRGSAAGEDAVKDLVGYIALAVSQGWKP
jgi:hypothetical protein